MNFAASEVLGYLAFVCHSLSQQLFARPEDTRSRAVLLGGGLLSLHRVRASISPPVNADRFQRFSRACLKCLFTTVRYLARQGQAFHGHENEEGNFRQLLLMRAEDNPELDRWLQNRTNMTSGSRQNNMMEMLGSIFYRASA